jgi:hypothetical protein
MAHRREITFEGIIDLFEMRGIFFDETQLGAKFQIRVISRQSSCPAPSGPGPS